MDGTTVMTRHTIFFGAILGLVLLAALRGVWPVPLDDSGEQPIATLRVEHIHALAFSPVDPKTVYLGHGNGVLRSKDGGRTWHDLVTKPGLEARALAVNPTNPDHLYVAGHHNLHTSLDGGVSWQAVAHNLPSDDIHALSLSFDDARRVFAYVYDRGLFLSKDGGRIWRKLSDRIPKMTEALAVAGRAPETLYAGGLGMQLVRSADGGETWMSILQGVNSRSIYSVAIVPSAQQTIYVGTEHGIYKSIDGGDFWVKLPYPGENAIALAVSPSRPQRLLAVALEGEEGLIFRSDDGGTTWEQ